MLVLITCIGGGWQALTYNPHSCSSIYIVIPPATHLHLYVISTQSFIMDVNDPASCPSGAQFLPQLPPLGIEPIQPFSDSLELEFELYIAQSSNRKVLTSRRRSLMRDILRNPSIQYPKENYPDRAERAKLYNLRNWTLQHFLLDDNQIYRKPENVRGVEYNQRYAACTYDSFDLIARTHRGLHHAGMFNSLNRALYQVTSLRHTKVPGALH